MAKIKDLWVVTGTYEKNGETKKQWKTVGALMENDKGQFIMLDRTFNPAGVHVEDGRGSIMISLFDPKEQGEAKQTAHNAAKADGYAPKQARADGFDQDIPF